MKKELIISALVFLLLFKANAQDNINSFNISRPYWSVNADHVLGVPKRIGAGINMNNPDNPQPATVLAFKEKTLPAIIDFDTTLLTTNEIVNSSFTYIENTSISTYSEKIYANFKARYGLSSASASYSRTVNQSQSNHSVLIIIESTRTLDNNDPQWKWQSKPSSERITDFSSRRLQFLQDYGSHYIQSILYGYRIAIEISVNKNSYSDIRQFSGELQAAIGGFSGSGGISVTRARTLDNKGVRISMNVYGDFQGSRSPLPTTLEGITNLLDDLRSGALRVRAAPLLYNTASYYSRLRDYPKSREIFEVNQGQSPDSPFGVPQGTIVAYYPTGIRNALKNDSTLQSIIPTGWTICNGLRGAPDLTDRFILGSHPINFGITGPNDEYILREGEHIRVITRRDGENYPTNYNGGPGRPNLNQPNHKHTVDLPPYYRLIYIMKL